MKQRSRNVVATYPPRPYPLPSLLSSLLRACDADLNRIVVRFSEGCATSYDLAPL